MTQEGFRSVASFIRAVKATVERSYNEFNILLLNILQSAVMGWGSCGNSMVGPTIMRLQVGARAGSEKFNINQKVRVHFDGKARKSLKTLNVRNCCPESGP